MVPSKAANSTLDAVMPEPEEESTPLAETPGAPRKHLQLLSIMHHSEMATITYQLQLQASSRRWRSEKRPSGCSARLPASYSGVKWSYESAKVGVGHQSCSHSWPEEPLPHLRTHKASPPLRLSAHSHHLFQLLLICYKLMAVSVFLFAPC